MATKRGKRTGAKTSKTKSKEAAASRAADRRGNDRRTGDVRRVKTVARAVERREDDRRTTPDRREGAGTRQPALLEQATRLRDAIQRSKLTAADPWGYGRKARGWSDRAQQLVDRVARGADAASLRQAVEALSAEVERDGDYQAARRLF